MLVEDLADARKHQNAVAMNILSFSAIASLNTCLAFSGSSCCRWTILLSAWRSAGDGTAPSYLFAQVLAIRLVLWFPQAGKTEDLSSERSFDAFSRVSAAAASNASKRRFADQSKLVAILGWPCDFSIDQLAKRVEIGDLREALPAGISFLRGINP